MLIKEIQFKETNHNQEESIHQDNTKDKILIHIQVLQDLNIKRNIIKEIILKETINIVDQEIDIEIIEANKDYKGLKKNKDLLNNKIDKIQTKIINR